MLNALKRVRPAVWIGLAIGAATLIIAYLAYRNQSSVATTTTDPTGVTNTPGSLNLPPPTDNGLSNLIQAISDQWAQLLATLPTAGSGSSGAGSGSTAGSGSGKSGNGVGFLGPPLTNSGTGTTGVTGGTPVTPGTGTLSALPGIPASEATHAHLVDVPTHSDLIRAGVL